MKSTGGREILDPGHAQPAGRNARAFMGSLGFTKNYMVPPSSVRNFQIELWFPTDSTLPGGESKRTAILSSNSSTIL